MHYFTLLQGSLCWHCRGSNKGSFADNNGKIGYIASSARYKDDIFDMEEVDWLYNLRPVNFTYKSDEIKKKQYGLIAEEVEKVNPDFVHYNNDGRVETVSYSQLIAPMLKAIQDQQALIEKNFRNGLKRWRKNSRRFRKNEIIRENPCFLICVNL